jgi:hypothetical protein
VGQALSRVLEAAGPDLDRLANNLRTWFHDWAAEGFFRAVELAESWTPAGSPSAGTDAEG